MPNYEQFANNATTTLDGAINASVTSLNVTSASGFPTTGNFRIVIGSEIMLVTAVSTNTFTVTRGYESSTAASHADNADVIQSVTAGALTTFLSDSVPYARDSSRPILNKIVNAAGTILDSTDFTWVNQGGASVSDLDSGGIHLSCPAASSNNIRALYKSAPSTPYSVRCGFTPFLHSDSTCIVGIGFRESSSSKMIIIGSAKIDEIAVYKFDDATSFDSSLFARVSWPMARNLQWLEIEDDGTDLYFRTGVDGINYFDIVDEARGTFFTTGPDQVLFYGNTNNATYPVGITVCAWEES